MMKFQLTDEVFLFDFLCTKFSESSKNKIKKWVKNQCVSYNGEVVTDLRKKLQAGGELTVDTHGGNRETDYNISFKIYYEDPQLIVVEKPVGISTAGQESSRTMLNAVNAYLEKKSKGQSRAFVVHRLDKEVSGILLFARSRKTMDWLKGHWPQTEKFYFALVEGRPEKPEGTIQGWLREGAKQKVYSTSSEIGAKYAITHYRIIRELDNYSLLEVKIDTGRKNQIRVHLSELGCPIVGDYKYGASPYPLRRVRLHACSFTFPHPLTGKMIRIESPMPKNFLVLKNEDENYKN